MSIFNTATATCPECGEPVEISWAASVNADRRPDLRSAILDRSFQAEFCPTCGQPMRLPPHLTYVDLARRNWILVEDVAELPQWAVHEAEAGKLFEESFGPAAPPVAQELASGVRPRLVFGWPALREKLICTELGLDDVQLELLKLAVMRGVAGTPVGDGLALRLVAGNDDTLTLDVVNDATETAVSTTELPRSLYDDIGTDTAAWAPLRARLVNEIFVDVQRFMIGA